MERPTFITAAAYAQLIANGCRSGAGEEVDPPPVVKLVLPGSAATWLLTELDPRAPELAFGLCDLGLGCPELGYVSLEELQSVQTSFGIAIEADEHFVGTQSLSAYAAAAWTAGRIVEINSRPQGRAS